MAESKIPQDRKPKVDRKDGVASFTVDGIKVSVAEDALDDFELLDDLAQLQEGNGSRLPAVARRLYGEQYKSVMDGLRADNGRVPIQSALDFVQRTFEVLAPNS